MQQYLAGLTWGLQVVQRKMEQVWSGRSLRFGPNLPHVPGVGPEPSGGLLAEPERWKERPSGGEGHSGGHQIFEEPGSVDGVSSRWRSHYHHRPHLH